MEIFVLLPSPLLGAFSMRPLATCLRALGREVSTADTAGVETPDQVASRYRAAAPEGTALWVGHSNAGLYLPRILRERPGDLGIFLDASVPDQRPHVSAPGSLLESLRELAGDSSRVPPWTEWWDAEQLKALVPDSGQRDLLRSGCPSTPLAYFSTEIDVPDDWSSIRAGYLSFDGPYVAQRERMAAAGWPTRHLPGHHLTPFTDPEPVADMLVDLASVLSIQEGSSRVD